MKVVKIRLIRSFLPFRDSSLLLLLATRLLVFGWIGLGVLHHQHQPTSQPPRANHCTRRNIFPMFAKTRGITVFEFPQNLQEKQQKTTSKNNLVLRIPNSLISCGSQNRSQIWSHLIANINFPHLQNQYSVRLPINSLCICKPRSYNTSVDKSSNNRHHLSHEKKHLALHESSWLGKNWMRL